MTRRRITIETDQKNIVLRGWRAGDLAREAGCRPIYVGSVNGWMLPAKQMPDVVAYLQHRNIRFDLLDLEPQQDRRSPDPTTPAPQGLLFGGEDQ